uniref:Bromodomain associated domain-containing protein n=1 Tax=Schizaphis graminum TaxID=13262 RepID=A0A2S2NYA3_SCHGA
MEQNAMETVNDNALDEKSDVEMEHLNEKDKQQKKESLVSLNELTECFNAKNEPQEINEDNNFDKNNTNTILDTKLKNFNEFVNCEDVIQLQQLKSGPSFEDASETTVIPELNNFFNQELEPEQYFKLISKQTDNFDLSYDENNINLPSFSDSHCTDSFSCSLYSNNISSPSSPSCISYMSSLPGTSNEHSEYGLSKEDLLFSYFEKISHDNLDPMSESNEVIETKDVNNFETELLIKNNHTNDTLEKKKLTEFDLLQYVLENVKLDDNNEVQNNSECFVEDRIIINPDIMYNIELKLHLKKMQLLTEQISKTPNDLTVLNKCKELMSIPEMKHKLQIIAEECKPFPDDISESNCYNIQHKDWNKIIVSQAAVLTDVGFDFTSKDILYLLRDEAINYIKRLAGIMKKNIDIQSKSCSPSSIDPILNSLKEIGVKGGVEELIKHYKNDDVFDRRNRLLKECEHFQSTIDQFVRHSLLTPTIKNKNDTQEFIFEEQSTSKTNVTKKNVEEKTSTNNEINHSESSNIDNINTATVKSECIKTNIDDVYNRKMYYTKCSNTDVQINDLLKCSHMITIPSNCKSNSFTSKKSVLSTNKVCKQKEKSTDLLKHKKLFDMLKSDNIFDATENKMNINKVKIQSTSTSNTVTPNSVKSIGLDHVSFQKVIDEFNKNFDHESIYGNRSSTQNKPVYNDQDTDNAMNEENYADYPNRE